MKRAFVVVVILVGFLSAALWMAANSVNLFGDCEESIASRKVSSDGRFEVIVATVDCGATTGLAQHVRLRELKADPIRDFETVAVQESLVPPVTVWEAGNSIAIAVSSEAEWYRKDAEWKSVRITYGMPMKSPKMEEGRTLHFEAEMNKGEP